MTRPIVIALFLLFSFSVNANIFDISDYHRYGPLSIRTQNPLYLLFLNETLERGASTLKRNEWGFSLETTFSNIMELGGNQSSNIDIDMELWRTALKAYYGISDTYSIGVEVPFFTFSGGFLDGFIQGFHHAFGFPNGFRQNDTDFRLAYNINHEGRTLYKPTPTPFGIGDIVVWNKYQMAHESTFAPALSLKASLKIPTGSTKNATGSGYPDLGVSVFIEKSIWRFHSYTLAGLVFNGGMRELAPILHPVQVTFGQGIEFNLFEYVSLVVQLTGNTSTFRNINIPDLTLPVCDFSVGFSGDIPVQSFLKRIHYEFSFSEDILAVGPSVDFSILFKAGVVF